MLTATAAAQSLRVASYNTCGGSQDVARTVARLVLVAPDVVALQELSRDGAAGLDAALAEVFAFRYFPAPTRGGGLGLVSRLPLHEPRYHASADGANGFVLAELDVSGRRVQIANLHLDPLKAWTWSLRLALPWQWLLHGAVHRRELAQVSRELRPRTPTIIVGDLNSYGGDAAPDWLCHRGYIDSFASVAPNADDTVTHRFTLAGIEIGDRIDFIFHDRELRTVDSRIIGDLPSDHALVVSTLAWADP